MEHNTPKQNMREFDKITYKQAGQCGNEIEGKMPAIEVFSRKELNRLEFVKKSYKGGGK